MALIALHNLSFHHPDSRPLFTSIDLEVSRGERVLLTGPSGAGKSTLLSIIGGLIPRWVPGTVSGSVERATDAVAMVFQNPEAQMVAPTVEEEIAFGMENRGIEPTEMRTRIDDVAARFHLEKLLPRSPAELSGGERQKVALAAAFAVRPAILLLDEPTSYLDPTSTAEFISLLDDLGGDITVILVEHKLDQAVRIADRLFRLNQAGSLEELPCGRDFDSSRYLPWRLRELAADARETEGDPEADAARGSNVDGDRGDARPRLTASTMSHSYANHGPALKSITLALRAGESVAVMGPNGAGKTTLLAKLSGILESRSGELCLDGIDSTRVGPRDRYGKILYLPQNPEHFFLRETVDEELLLSAGGEPGASQANAAELPPATSKEDAAFRFGLEGVESRNPYSLSEGEKRRLNLACAFLDDRRILLLDEPTFGLDYDSFARLVESLRMLKRGGGSLLLVTHSPELAFLVADRILFLNDGELHFEGSPEKALSASEFPAAYLPVWERERCLG